MTTEKLIWGAEAIAKAIDRDQAWTFRALKDGKIPGARKISGRWALNPRVFFATFESVTP
jgi:hypothetical protein